MIKLIDLIKEEDGKIIIPRNIEGRKKKRLEMIYQEIQDYIKTGSKGYLDLSYSPITSLPDNLKKIGGDLYLTDTLIETLPNNLQVGEDLVLAHTPIKTLPSNLQVGGNLDLRRTPIAKKYSEDEIRQMIESTGGFVKGDIYI